MCCCAEISGHSTTKQQLYNCWHRGLECRAVSQTVGGASHDGHAHSNAFLCCFIKSVCRRLFEHPAFLRMFVLGLLLRFDGRRYKCMDPEWRIGFTCVHMLPTGEAKRATVVEVCVTDT
jgi:hypothetical protein